VKIRAERMPLSIKIHDLAKSECSGRHASRRFLLTDAHTVTEGFSPVKLKAPQQSAFRHAERQ
jgi:hypothetical protein